MKIQAHRVLTPEGFVYDRTVLVENGRIKGVFAQTGEFDLSCHTAVPGLVDEHVHGGYGADVMTPDIEPQLKWLDFLMENGVTQVLSGIYTAPVARMRDCLKAAREITELQKNGASGAKLAGVHLEGPFISPHALGAMDAKSILPPTVENYRRITEGYEDLIRLVTLAPEMPGAETLIRYLTERGIPVIAGHTAATAEEGAKAFADGVGGICHFFNASTPIHHRKPGILTEGLLDPRIYCECICDFVHVHPSAVKLIYQCKGADRMMIVSDAIRTTGLPDGEYTDGTGETIVVRNGESRTLEGNLSGGSSLMLREIKNLISIGISEEDAFTMASRTPCRHLRIEGGEIRAGVRAEILCLDENLAPVATLLGEQIRKGKSA